MATIDEKERISDPLECLLDETDEYCRTHSEREDGEAMFKRIRDRRHALRQVPSVCGGRAIALKTQAATEEFRFIFWLERISGVRRRSS